MGSSGEKSAKKAKKEKKEEKSASKKRDRDGLPIPSTPGDNDDDEKLNPVCAIASPLADGKLTKKLLKVVKKGKKFEEKRREETRASEIHIPREEDKEMQQISSRFCSSSSSLVCIHMQ